MISTGRADVAVVGGGPTAVAVASTLHRAGVNVVVVAGATGAGRRPSFGQSAPPGTDRLVRDLIAPTAFDPDAHLRSLGNRASWGSTSLVLTDFMFNPFGTGWHLDRAAFDRQLLDALAESGVEVLRDQDVVASAHPREWQLTVDGTTGTRTLGARVVCDASGRRATVARAHGASTTRVDHLVAVACLVGRSDDDDDLTSTVQAVPSGWWYTAPVPGGSRAFVHFTDPDLLDRAVTRSWLTFADAMGAADHVAEIATASGALDAPRTPVLFAAGSRRLTSVVGDGWVAAGDAAVTFDPLSSQGILTALLTGREAGTTIARMLAPGADASGDASRQYAAMWQRVVADHEREYARCFDLEARFAHEPFWARRRARLAA